MDRVTKGIRKLPPKQAKKLIEQFESICVGNTRGVDVRQLKGQKHLYRIRVGNARLVYQHRPRKSPVVLFIGKRDDQTYRTL